MVLRLFSRRLAWASSGPIGSSKPTPPLPRERLKMRMPSTMACSSLSCALLSSRLRERKRRR
eukprot:8795366-Pyramimonas_sp.AAC.1